MTSSSRGESRSYGRVATTDSQQPGVPGGGAPAEGGAGTTRRRLRGSADGAPAAGRLGPRRLGHRTRLVADLRGGVSAIRRRPARVPRSTQASRLRHGERLRTRRRRVGVGEILAGYPRDSFVLATKVYFPMSARDRGLSRGQIQKQIDASLERLRVDHVDLYQCHRYDDDVPLEETMEALTEVVRAGKARWIGFSEWPPDRIQAALDVADAGVCPPGRTPKRIALRAIRQVRLQPAAVLGAVAGSRGRGHPAVRAQRHLADRLVAARPGRADRQVPARRGAAARFARAVEQDEPVHQAVADRRHPGRRRPPPPRGESRGSDDVTARAGLGAAAAERGRRDRRRLAARAGARERRRRRRGAVRRHAARDRRRARPVAIR